MTSNDKNARDYGFKNIPEIIEAGLTENKTLDP